MKALKHNFQNITDWGRFVYQNNPERNDDIDFMSEMEKDKEVQSEFQPLSDERRGEMDKDQEGRNHQQSINEMIEHMESEGSKEAPEGFEDIPASEFLQRTPEDLHDLFVTKDNVIDFHGNEGVRQYIGMGDLYQRKQTFIKMNGSTVGKRSIWNGKVGYLDKSGSYLPIYGGEQIELEVTEEEQKGFEDIHTYSEEEEMDAKKEFRERVEADEKALEEMKEEMRDALREQGLSAEDIENLSSEEMFAKVGKILAVKVEERYGIPWQVVLAQSSLESNKGKRALGKNFFGIKAGKGYLKEVQTFVTHEYENGVKVKKPNEIFRKYNSMAESFNDYGQFLARQSRYRPAFAHKDNPRNFLETVIRAGYATTPAEQYVRDADSKLRELGYEEGIDTP